MSQNSKNLIIALLVLGLGYLVWKLFFEKAIEPIKAPKPETGYKPLGLELVQQHFQPITPIPSTSVIGEVQLKTPTYTTSVVSAPTLADREPTPTVTPIPVPAETGDTYPLASMLAAGRAAALAVTTPAPPAAYGQPPVGAGDTYPLASMLAAGRAAALERKLGR